VSASNVRLNLIYIPSAYGVVALGGPSVVGEPGGKIVPAMSTSNIEAEKAEAQRFQMERIERELNELKAQFERVKGEIKRTE